MLLYPTHQYMLPYGNIPLRLPNGNTINTGSMIKDKEQTKQRIVTALENIIRTKGFEYLGINSLAQEAGVSKMLIYRYYGGLNELIGNYIEERDWWINADADLLKSEQLEKSLKEMYHRQIDRLRNNVILRRLYRWELSTDNPITDKLRKKREDNGKYLIERVAKITNIPAVEIAPLASILSAAISDLALMEDLTVTYNGIELYSEKGWKQIKEGIDKVIDLWIKSI